MFHLSSSILVSKYFKEEGGVIDPSNNMSYPTFEDGGKYNLLNLSKIPNLMEKFKTSDRLLEPIGLLQK